ncbi:MAG: aminoacyl-tRNA hydrolase, partial [Patescibacteria group bacterium]
MKLIIGLGNPGKEYQNARHNVGFAVVEKIAGTIGAELKLDKKMNATVAKGKLEDMLVVLAKPQTFVNKSGEAVKKLAKSYKLKTKNLIVIHDDLDIEFGNFKLSFGKNSGCHRGVESIIKALKT